MPIFYRMMRPVITFLFRFFYRPQIIGKKNIPKSGPYILIGNHTNYFDPILLISLDKDPIHFMAKHTLNRGIKGLIFKGMGIIPVDRTKNKNPLAVTKAKDILNNGGIVGIFPEGTINRTDEVLLNFKMGAVSIAKSTKVSIIPFAIKGSYKLFSRDLKIEFSKAFKVEGADLEQENLKLMRVVREMLERE